MTIAQMLTEYSVCGKIGKTFAPLVSSLKNVRSQRWNGVKSLKSSFATVNVQDIRDELQMSRVLENWIRQFTDYANTYPLIAFCCMQIVMQFLEVSPYTQLTGLQLFVTF